MTEKMTQLEYAKSYAPASRIPESFLTMGDIVEMLERIEELKSDLANANEGAHLMYMYGQGGEAKLLQDWDLPSGTPEYKEAQQVADKFNFETVVEQEF